MDNAAPSPPALRNHADMNPSPWVQRWSHLVATGGTVLDLACGSGRHMRWFSQRGHPVLGVDISADALAVAAEYGKVLLADLERDPWPLQQPGAADQVRTFDAVLVTNYLWRPLLDRVLASVAMRGVLIYETFAAGNESVGRPSRSDFLLQPGELLQACRDLQVVAYESGFLTRPDRFVQRVAALRPAATGPQAPPPRYALDPDAWGCSA